MKGCRRSPWDPDELSEPEPPERSAGRNPTSEYDAHRRRTNPLTRRLLQSLETERDELDEAAAVSMPQYQILPRLRPSAATPKRSTSPRPISRPSTSSARLLGPHGATVKHLQGISSAKNMATRGRGSVKEGRLRRGERNDRVGRRTNNDIDVDGNLPLPFSILVNYQAKADAGGGNIWFKRSSTRRRRRRNDRTTTERGNFGAWPLLTAPPATTVATREPWLLLSAKLRRRRLARHSTTTTATMRVNFNPTKILTIVKV